MGFKASPARRRGRKNAGRSRSDNRKVSDRGQFPKCDGGLDEFGESIGICVAEGPSGNNGVGMALMVRTSGS